MYKGGGGLCRYYRHMYADDELYWVAGCWNSLWTRPDLAQYHAHFSRTGQAEPGYWEKNARGAEAADTAMFIARSTLGFPDHAPCQPIAGHRFDLEFFQKNYTGRAQRNWNSFFAPQYPPEAERRMSEALNACARAGQKNVVIFGAGRHTHRLANALRSTPVCVLGIVDDNPALQGTRLWNYPIMATADALRLRPQAVILSSDSAEEKLAVAAGPFAAAGIAVIHLYSKPAQAA